MEKTYICRRHANLQIVLKNRTAQFVGGHLATSDEDIQKGVESHEWYGFRIKERTPQPEVQKNQEGKNSTTVGEVRRPRKMGPPPKDVRDAAYAKAMESLNEQVLDKKKRKVPTRSAVERASKRALLDIAEEWEIEVPEENSPMAVRNHVKEFFDHRWGGVKKRQSTMKKTKHKKEVAGRAADRKAEAARKKKKYEDWKNRDNKLIADKTPKDKRGE